MIHFYERELSSHDQNHLLDRYGDDAVQDYECFFIHIGDEQQNDQIAASGVEGWSGILIDRTSAPVSEDQLKKKFEDTLTRDKASINITRLINRDINRVTSLKPPAENRDDLESALHDYFESIPVSARKLPSPFIINNLNQLPEVITSFVQSRKKNNSK